MCVCVWCEHLYLQLFDQDQKGYITKQELQSILCKAFAMEEDKAALLFDCVDVDKDGRITFGIGVSLLYSSNNTHKYSDILGWLWQTIGLWVQTHRSI